MTKKLLNVFDDFMLPTFWDNNFWEKLSKIDFSGRSLFNDVSGFVPKNGFYELTMDVDSNSNADNVEINLDKDDMITIKYHIKNVTSEHMVSVKEYLPKDADSNTIDAEINNGKLIVTVKRKHFNTKVQITK